MGTKILVENNRELPQTLFSFIWYFLRKNKLVVFISIFLSVMAGFWGPFNSILIKITIDLLPQVKNGEAAILFTPVALIVINFLIFDNVTWRSITFIRAKYIPVIINNIISSVMDYVLSHSHQFYQENLSGKISKQITNLADGIEKIIASVASNFLRGVSLLLTACVTSYFVNPIFCVILIAWFALFAGASLLLSKKFIFLADAQASAESSVVGELVDTVSNHSNVRIFARKTYEKIRMNPYFTKQQKAYSNTYFYAVIMHSVQGGLIAIMMSFSAYFLVKLYAQNLVSVGDFALIFGLIMETAYMIWLTMSEVDEFNKAVGKCKQSLLALMNHVEIKDKVNAVELKNPYGKIKFNNVKFHYKGTEPLFKNKSITINPGEKIGLVGYSGSGKSSFVNLIMRLYDITDGQILIDSYDIRDVTQDSLYKNIGIIPQDPVLFQRSIMDNIRYGNIDASDAEVIQSAKLAHAHDFITSLPKGYNSLVGERGIKLSGGQRQRIAIARVILKNAPILILDEATSQLDSVTEALIQDSIWELMQNKTTIVIAHRLSTLLHMDRILVFDKGNIVEEGGHANLLLQNNLYTKLWNAQVGGLLGDNINEVK